MTSKRRLSQISDSDCSKKTKTAVNNYLHNILQESGLVLKHPPEKCTAVTREAIDIIRNVKKALENHFDYPRNVSELYTTLAKECQNLDIFKHYLYPNIIVVSENDKEHNLSESVIKILLNVYILQPKLIDYIFDKAIELAAQSKCGPWIQMILKCLSTLDSIVDEGKVATHIINLLDITTEKSVRLEIILAIPDIINDQQHITIANEISRILIEDHDLIPATLDCLSNLSLSDEQYEQLQKRTLTLLSSLTKCMFFPKFVKFLLTPGHVNDNTYFEAIQGLRNALGWSSMIADPQEVATSQVLTAIAIRNSIVTSKAISGAWLKSVSMCKVYTDHKPIDLVILLLLYSTSEDKKRNVESFIKKQTKLNIFKEELLDEAFDNFKPILKDYLQCLLELAGSLLKTHNDPVIESLAQHIYILMFSKLDDCCHTIVGNLLLQLGMASKQCFMNILVVLTNVAVKDISLLKSQGFQILTLLDRMSDMTVTEIRAVMNLLCSLAYSDNNSLIRDDVSMIISKELASSNPRIKIQGILAGIHAVKYLIATVTDDNALRDISNNQSPQGSTSHLTGDLREAAQFIELISISTHQFPEMTIFFYDELSKIISATSCVSKNFLSWLGDAITNDLQENFIVNSIEHECVDDLKLTMQYCLNEAHETHELFAINIAGLTLHPKIEVCIAILSPLFQLCQIAHSKMNNGNLTDIEALLGCPIVLPEFDIETIADLDQVTITKIIDCLLYTVNWFIELLNAFSLQNDDTLKPKTLKRLTQIEELQSLIAEILLRTKISYRAPSYMFNINKYLGEPVKKFGIAQGYKQKGYKKVTQDDSVLPEIARSQGMQNNNPSMKNTLNIMNDMTLRSLNLNLLELLNNELYEHTESGVGLNIKSLTFLLKCININLEEVLVSKMKRSIHFKQDPVIYDSKKGEDSAKFVNEILPKIMSHLEFITSQIEKYNLQNNISDCLSTSTILDYLYCLEYIYKMLNIFFNWIGFRKCHSGLFKSSLRAITSPKPTNMSLKDLLTAVCEDLKNHQKFCLQISTAISLTDLIKTFQSYTNNKNISEILRIIAKNFLSQQWKSPEGVLEKGLIFNQSIDHLAAIYLINNEILELKNLSLQLTYDIKKLKSRNDTLDCMKCINKSNFSILYRNLGKSLHGSVQNGLNKRMTNSEHVNLWKDVTSILKYMSEIAKTLENRHNLSSFFKRTLPVLKLFLSHGVPILEIEFKNQTEEVLEILKTLQQSTRFLQSLCCHSRLTKDKVLMSKVPYARQLLETLIYKVKAALVANGCSEAFWLGHLKNKDIHGEIIVSQTSIDEELAEDCDDHLPEDEDSYESDDEMLNPDSRSVSDIV